MTAKTKNILGWILQVLLGIIYLAAGALKFTGPSAAEAFGLPSSAWIIIGTIEIAGAISLFIPKWTIYGVVVLGCVMIGAVVTHFVTGFVSTAFMPAILLVLLILLYLLRRGSKNLA